MKVNPKISYIDEGQGDVTVLFLHGWGAKKENFLQSINLLKSKYRCIAIDLPGFGESEELKKSFCVDDYVDVVDEFIISHDIKKVILVGHSFGGRVMIKLNVRTMGARTMGTGVNVRNYEIIKNIFIDSAGIKHEMAFDKKLKVNAFKTMKNILNVIPGSDAKKKERVDKLKDKFGSPDYKNANPILRETLVRVVNEDLKDLLKNITAETLLIWGENDTDTPLSDAKIFEREIKNSGLVVLKNVGHFSFIEDSYTYLRVLESYLLKV